MGQQLIKGQLIEKVSFFENLMNNFVKLNNKLANEEFKKRYGYDLRESDNGDFLKFTNWSICKDTISLHYIEITRHDKPDSITLDFNISDLFINNIKSTITEQPFLFSPQNMMSCYKQGYDDCLEGNGLCYPTNVVEHL